MPWFRTENERVADELEKVHDEISRIVRQLESHAEAAPYPHVAERLRGIQSADEEASGALARRLVELGRQPNGSAHGAVKSGRNSWERLNVTVEDYRGLMRQLTQLWVRWDDEHPADAALIRDLIDAATRNREDLLDLAARSDPHALD